MFASVVVMVVVIVVICFALGYSTWFQGL